MELQNTLEVLRILQSAAKIGVDPKPALRNTEHLSPETALLCIGLADEIEARFSQSESLRHHPLPGISKDMLQLLQKQEKTGDLAPAYQTLTEEIQFMQKEMEDSLWNTPKDFEELAAACRPTFDAIKKSATSAALKATLTQLVKAIEADKTALKSAASPARECISAKLECLKNPHWKVIGAAAGGLLLGLLLRPKK